MKKLIAVLAALCFSMILASCNSSGEHKKNDKDQAQLNDEKWQTLKTISGRNIIAELEQTTTGTSIRDEAFAKVRENEDLEKGLFGKNTPELQEDLGMQWIEAEAATEAINKVYGGIGGLNQKGVIFLENQASGADQSGFWIGIKEPDEKVNELVTELQKQVDEGKILAKYIYIFRSDFTQKENNQLVDEVHQVITGMAKEHAAPERVSFGVSVDTKTGTVEISHDFLTVEQKEELQKQFSNHKLAIKQEGRLVPLPGETDVSYPPKKTTTTPLKEGGYVMSVSENSMLVVSATSHDFSATGGKQKYFDAISYSFPQANTKLEVGQRVLVEAWGPIMESYPGQGLAKYVEVLPTYQPKNADLTEAEVVHQAIKQSKQEGGAVLAVNQLAFDSKSDQWKVEFTQEEEVFEVVIKDKK
ncbi:hypothetical protein CEW92_18025 [Bacillaceae bacterium SAS-127]|nr:hypothetical protein CEW92_18025 [Bacillaceae bacterium SAS-127]